MSCSRTQHGGACGDRTQDLSIRSQTPYHYATALPKIILYQSYINYMYVFIIDVILRSDCDMKSSTELACVCVCVCVCMCVCMCVCARVKNIVSLF